MFERKVLQGKSKFENNWSGIYSNFPSNTSAGKVSTFYQCLSKTLHVALQALQALAPSPLGSPLPTPMCLLPFITDHSLNSPHSFSPLLINFEKLFSSFQARFKMFLHGEVPSFLLLLPEVEILFVWIYAVNTLFIDYLSMQLPHSTSGEQKMVCVLPKSQWRTLHTAMHTEPSSCLGC